jgi:hypothetical protein
VDNWKLLGTIGSIIIAGGTTFAWIVNLRDKNLSYSKDLKKIEETFIELKKTHDELTNKYPDAAYLGVLGSYSEHKNDISDKSQLNIDTDMITSLVAGNAIIIEKIDSYSGNELTDYYRHRSKDYDGYATNFRNKVNTVLASEKSDPSIRQDDLFPDDFVDAVKDEIEKRNSLWYNRLYSYAINW